MANYINTKRLTALCSIEEDASKMFFQYLKTKTEKPLRVLIITYFIYTADDLFEWLSVAYKERAVFSLGLFQRKIKFQNKECWYINAYYEEELKFFDLNTFDKIVIGSDVPENFVKKVAAKVKDRSVIRVCDMTDVINVVINKEVESHV